MKFVRDCFSRNKIMYQRLSVSTPSQRLHFEFSNKFSGLLFINFAGSWITTARFHVTQQQTWLQFWCFFCSLISFEIGQRACHRTEREKTRKTIAKMSAKKKFYLFYRIDCGHQITFAENEGNKRWKKFDAPRKECENIADNSSKRLRCRVSIGSNKKRNEK